MLFPRPETHGVKRKRLRQRLVPRFSRRTNGAGTNGAFERDRTSAQRYFSSAQDKLKAWNQEGQALVPWRSVVRPRAELAERGEVLFGAHGFGARMEQTERERENRTRIVSYTPWNRRGSGKPRI